MPVQTPLILLQHGAGSSRESSPYPSRTVVTPISTGRLHRKSSIISQYGRTPFLINCAFSALSRIYPAVFNDCAAVRFTAKNQFLLNSVRRNASL